MTMKNNIHDYRTDTDKLFGIYRGVVEDRKDKELLCRCRIRVLGIHDELKEKDDLNGIPTEELPWAEPCYGLFGGSVSGNGSWSVPLQGSHVFVFFENGNWMQPRYFLTAPGMPELPPNGEIGFNDPDEEYPDKDWLEESDVHRLMKRDLLAETSLLKVKLPSIDDGVGIALGGDWTEHPPMYQAEYPNNSVLYSDGGVYTEIDSTEGNRRWHIYHPSNSYIEIGEVGQMTIRNAESRYDIVGLSRLEHTMESHHRNVAEARSSFVGGSEHEEIGVNHYRKIGVLDNKSVGVGRWTDIGVNDSTYVGVVRHADIGVYNLVYSSINDSHFTGVQRTEWNDLFKSKFTGIEDLEVVGIKKTKWIIGDEEIQVDQERKSWVSELDLFECDGTIHLKATEEIILEAPWIEFRADVFADFAETTMIAGELTWTGVAIGTAAFATTAGLAVPGTPVPVISDIPVVAPEPPEPPVSPPLPTRPSKPPGPPPLVPPGPPAIPPELDYSDVPAEPDDCE